ncbi:hypothetical protein [Floridanema evergladense]|uniref:Uncharacterized protein n=1 Tax=Floridaenema evergladense BLCC-F167 TaxID=3153639 RepID=A0ABV4WTT6_9CYAN
MEEPQNDPVLSNYPKRLDIAKVCVYGLSFLSAALFLFIPLINLLHPNPWKRTIGTIHSLAAVLLSIVAVYAGHLAFPLLRGSIKVLHQMRTLAFWTSLFTLVAIASGNLAYMRYLAGAEYGGSRAWFEEHTPLAHYIFMEYHIFSVLFTLPLGVVCTWILFSYGDAILEKQNSQILAGTSIALMAMMFFSMGGLITGLALSKVHGL